MGTDETERPLMSDDDYEDAYREARLLISELGYGIGVPFQMPAGRVLLYLRIGMGQGGGGPNPNGS